LEIVDEVSRSARVFEAPSADLASESRLIPMKYRHFRFALAVACQIVERFGNLHDLPVAAVQGSGGNDDVLVDSSEACLVAEVGDCIEDRRDERGAALGFEALGREFLAYSPRVRLAEGNRRRRVCAVAGAAESAERQIGADEFIAQDPLTALRARSSFVVLSAMRRFMPSERSRMICTEMPSGAAMSTVALVI
jgi:hypothetical protein